VDTTDQTCAGKQAEKDRGKEKKFLRGAGLAPFAPMEFLSFLAPERERKPTLGGELRREEHRLSRTRVCLDRVETVDDLCEGVFRLPPPPAPARPESHRSRGQASPNRPT
jgi:hypothetical protein